MPARLHPGSVGNCHGGLVGRLLRAGRDHPFWARPRHSSAAPDGNSPAARLPPPDASALCRPVEQLQLFDRAPGLVGDWNQYPRLLLRNRQHRLLAQGNTSPWGLSGRRFATAGVREARRILPWWREATAQPEVIDNPDLGPDIIESDKIILETDCTSRVALWGANRWCVRTS